MSRFRAGFAIGCGLWSISSLVLASSVGVTIFTVLVAFYGAIAIFVIAAVANVVSARRRTRFSKPWLEPAAVLLVFLLILADAPFYARFFVSKPLLERYVASVAVGNRKPTVPQRVGLFEIAEVEVLPDGAVRMITNGCMFDECGLVFRRGGPPPIIGEDRYKSIRSSWWQWWRSW
jgi:hypothetical protein